MKRRTDVVSSHLVSLAHPFGFQVGALGARPEEPLELYDFEGCPFCRKAREALSVLDLDARIYPCPKKGTRFREELRERGGKLQFPYLVDPNAGVEMYESDDIVAHLFKRYGDGRIPAALRLGPLTLLSLMPMALLRGALGTFARASKPPAQPLELYSFEASPYCRIVRELLCSLELPYVLRSVARGSPRREAFRERAGTVQVPFLVDPNTDTELFESAEIVAYLERTYAV